ncbi:long-chain-acyl-CoA synthetase [Methylocapsa sp. S129]|uniref:long-chain-acyl-CoA synthetase n=1 Tax=Methylocapsa sp. S129 TaxID=1641869 RepID=UPI001FEDC579|nr:long-chain-acyl-CoA synthetase [Methylocapsa sp. S129]
MFDRIKSEIAYLSGLRRALARTTPVGKNPTRTYCDLADELAIQYGDQTALLSDRETFSYREWNGRANRYARWARSQGLGKGDVVGLLMPNRPEYLAIWLGLARAGLITALINTNVSGASLAHSVNVAAAKALIVDASLAPQLATARDQLNQPLLILAHGAPPPGMAEPRIDEIIETFSDAPLTPGERVALTIDDGALYVYTSGTTGMPKAARITHSRLQRMIYGFSAVMNAQASDRMYQSLPMYHSTGGVLATGAVLSVGGSCFIRERFSASDFWADIVRHQCTMFVYVGELCRYLLNAPPTPNDKAHRIRLCFGNGLRPDIFTPFRDRFGIKQILEFYAASEGNVALFNLDSHPGAVGRIPVWAKKSFPFKIVAYDVEQNIDQRNAEGRCIECAPNEVGEAIGEILDDPNKPASRFDGYADAAATKAKILRDVFREGDSWFRTGDLLRRDAAGYFYFVDRIGDTFRWKGENVSTTEVSEAIATFPGVREANVYGVSVPGYEGRAGMAAMVVDDADHFDLSGLRAHIAAHLPTYARPVFLRFRRDLDTTGTFKQKKTELVAEGFELPPGADPVYFDDRTIGAYRPIAADFTSALRAGSVKL